MTSVAEAPRAHLRPAVVVGTDGSGPNRAAVRWATHEAEASGRPLDLVCIQDLAMPAPHRGGVTGSEVDLTAVGRLAADIAAERPELTVRHVLAAGDPVRGLLLRSADQGLLVVGKRGLGTFARLLIGSTSIAVAGRSRVPTVIVPDTWDQDQHLHEPVVVGLDPADVHPGALSYAFAEARRRGVGLVVAHGWEPPSLAFSDLATVAAAIDDWQEHCSARLRAAVAPLRCDFGGIHVELEPRHGHPSTVLLDVAESAQLLVLGRHDDGRLGGFPYGSVTRNVLHHATVPVAVVPSGAQQ